MPPYQIKSKLNSNVKIRNMYLRNVAAGMYYVLTMTKYHFRDLHSTDKTAHSFTSPSMWARVRGLSQITFAVRVGR